MLFESWTKNTHLAQNQHLMKIGNLKELRHKELTSKTGERFSLSAVMTDLVEHKGIFVRHEIIPSGRRTSAPHSHTAKEEMVVVLSGSIRAHLGEDTFDLNEGSFTTFVPGGSGHFLENVSEREATCLVICSKPNEDEILYS